MRFFFEIMRYRGIEVIKNYLADKNASQSILQCTKKEVGPATRLIYKSWKNF